MNILHLVNGNIISDDGYSQRIKREENTWKKIESVNVSIFDIVSWRLLKNPLEKRNNIRNTKNYALQMGYKFGYRQGYPLLLFLNNPDRYFKICAKSIERFCNNHDVDFIFAENLMCAYMAYYCNKMSGIPYIIDYHGVAPEEYKLSGKALGKVNYGYYKKMELLSLENANGVVCVSNRFKKYLLQEFKLDESNIIIVPSCIETNKMGYNHKNRDTLRNQLGIGDDTKVIIYAGGCGHWHCDDKIANLFGKLYSTNKNIFLVFLTRKENHNLVKKNLRSSNVPDSAYYIDSVSNEKVFEFYSAADYGIIIRFDSLINEVASPTKVIEYMSSGLGVISTTNVGDINEFPGVSFLEEYNALCSDEYEIKGLVEFINNRYDRTENLRKCSEFLLEEYTWDSMISRYKYLFEKMSMKRE